MTSAWQRIAALALGGLAWLIAVPAWTQTAGPLAVENEQYDFEFTVEANSVVTYRAGGTGFTCVHNSSGGAAGSRPDYGLVVHGQASYSLTAEQAKRAGLGDAAVDLKLADVPSQAELDRIVTVQMAVHEREPAGMASFTDTEGNAVELPYFVWQRTVGSRTHHALMYVVRHQTGFILVQVESPAPLTGEQLKWLTSQLRLVAPPAAPPAG